MYPLTKHITQTTDRIDAALDGWTLGVLVIEDGQANLQLDDNSLIPVPTGAAGNPLQIVICVCSTGTAGRYLRGWTPG